MGVYTLVDPNDPILKQPTERFDFENPQIDPKQLAEQLAETMILHNGIGLAAPQCGIPLSVFVVGNPRDRDTIMAMFNPSIVNTMGEETYIEEGCLTYPGLYIKVKRPQQVRLRFTDMNGETTTAKYTGMTARAIQHECDHLQGIIYKKKANRIHLDRAQKKYKQILRRMKKTA
jgi:peptide deformylase